MSWQASEWVNSLPYDAVAALPFRVLSKLANASSPEGQRAFLAKSTLSEELGVSQQSIRRAFRDLEHARLIVRGDQEFVRHIPANRRPVVYDLVMPRQQVSELWMLEEPDDSPGDTTDVPADDHSRGYIQGVQGYPQGVQKTASGGTTVVLHKNQRTIPTKTKISGLDLSASARELGGADAAAPFGRCPDGHPLLKRSVWASADMPRCRQETDLHSMPVRDWLVSA